MVKNPEIPSLKEFKEKCKLENPLDFDPDLGLYSEIWLNTREYERLKFGRSY
jgi:hypothetical protein